MFTHKGYVTVTNRYFKIFETGIFILGIVFYTGVISSKSVSQATGIGSPILSTITSLVRYFLWFSCTILICTRWKTSWAIAKRNKFVWIVAGLSIMSTLWSTDPAYTRLVSSEVTRMVTFALYVASRFKLQKQLHVLASTLGCIALVSALFAIVLPSAGIDNEQFLGAWTGVFGNKNTFGKFMSLSMVTFAVLVVPQNVYVSRVYRILSWGGLFLSYALVILSTSQTSFVISTLFLLILFFYRLYQNQGNKRKLYREISSLVILVITFIVSSSLEIILTILGRDLTLTGRTEIWRASIPQLLDNNPWLGFGRGAFWGPDSSFARTAGQAVGRLYIPPTAHNGYIDIALEIGIIGLLCFLISFVVVYRHAILRSFVSRTPKDLWPLAFLTWLLGYNLTETNLLLGPNLAWPLYVMTTLCAMPTGQAVCLNIRRSSREINSNASS